MEPHRESTDGSNTSPAYTLLSSYSQVFLVFFLQVQISCYILSSCATSQVRRAVSLSVVPGQHCCLEEDPSRPTISFPWAVLCVVDFLSLILVGHSKGKTHKTMKRRQVHHTSTSNDFHAALFVDEYPRPSIDVCTIGNVMFGVPETGLLKCTLRRPEQEGGKERKTARDIRRRVDI